MSRVTLFDGANIKSKELSNWTADDWFSTFGSYFGTDHDTPASLYSAVGWLYACVNLRSDRVSEMPWAIMSGETQMLTNEDDLGPYPYLDNFTELLELTEISMCLCGYAYWFKQRNARNMPLGLRWFAPESMQPLYDSNVGIAGFRRYAGAGSSGVYVPTSANDRIYAPEDIVYFRQPNAFSELAPGTPPAAAALADAQVLSHMSDFTSAFFSRGAIKATILKVDQDTAPDQQAKIEDWWARFFSGIKNAWSTATIRSNAVEAVVVGEGLESLTNSELTTERRQSIATALGVPHSIVAADAANFATAQQDEINFLNNCIIPESRMIQRTLNRQLFAPVGLHFEFQPERLSAMQEDEEQRAQAYSVYVNAQMRPSIAAQLVGLSLPAGVEYADLDADVVASQALAQQQADAQLARINQPPPQQPPAQLTGPTDAQRAEEVRRLKGWAKGKKNPDLNRFQSALLSHAEKLEIVQGDAAGEDAPFLFTYP